MAEDMQSNPDYQLVMTFLRNITPGDMSPEAANQLIAIGQRIQGGGVLSDREREMFTAVVGNISARNQVSIGGMSEGEMNLPMQNQMPSQDGMTYGPSSGVTVAPSNVMSMDDAIAAGLVNPTRPQARPTAPMQSMRPQARPMR
jgi:hypothetical protein